jgi:Beta-lactamase
MNTGGLSTARLDRMHNVMAGHVERGEAPGLVTLVSRRGEVHVDAIGMQAVGGNDPMRRDTIFRIASMTKPITAAARIFFGDNSGWGFGMSVVTRATIWQRFLDGSAGTAA